MARTLVASDPFTYSDGVLATVSGGNWANVTTAGGSGVISVSTNRFTGASAGVPPGGQVARWTGAGTFSDDQYSSAVFGETDFASGIRGIGVVARTSADTDGNRDYYYAFAVDNNTYSYGKVVNGTHTSFGTGSQTWNDGDRIEIECEGTTIRILRNGVEIASTTDSDLTTGKPGIHAAGGISAVWGDDWEGGNITGGGGGGGGSVVPRRAMKIWSRSVFAWPR
jgi:hypothetical protein